MKNAKAPGCYGYAITNDPTDEYCRQCVWFKPCCVEAKNSLLKIHEEMNVSDMLAKHDLTKKPICTKKKTRKISGRKKIKAFQVSGDQAELIASLPKKPGKVVEQLAKRGIDIKVELASGNNPFEDAPPNYMKTPCRLLLEGGFNRGTLGAALDRDFMKWSKLTRKSHEGIIMCVLEALQVVENNNGYYRIKQ